MARTSDPDFDKTNPRKIHQNFDQEDQSTELYSPETGVNTPDNVLEADREEPTPELLQRRPGTYPDDYVRVSPPHPQDLDDVIKEERATEDYYDSTVTFDPEGDEAEPEETRPLLNNIEND